MKADEIGMDEIWKAAQLSRYQAFISIQQEEALIGRTLVLRLDSLARV